MVEITELAKDISERLRNGSYECVICSNAVYLRDKLWSCTVCYGVVHMPCVRSWVKAQVEEREKRDATAGGSSASSISLNEFRCPICQALTPVSAVAEFSCFCGKVCNPTPDPLLVPGSCGDTCGRRRKDELCPHACTLMCHPGPCTPCQLTRTQSCFCGKTSKTVGCSSGIHGFECEGICGKLRECGKHNCGVPCHEGPCPVCTILSTDSCYCGATKRTQRCGESGPFPCGNPCSKIIDCGNHRCLSKCHKDACEPCFRTPERMVFCPCGKVRLQQLLNSPRKSCLDPIPSCGLVCEGFLPCGHTCSDVCHESPTCPPCTKLVSMKCGCGSQNYQIYCFFTYLPPGEWKAAAERSGLSKDKIISHFPPVCKKPCRKHLSCGKHTCKENCCTNEDHTCYKICTKRLSCGTHSCGQLCHKGLCPPCSVASYDRLYCRCRRTWVEPPVPCGTKPPNCSHECIVPRPCGHPANHPCHIENECPVCVVPVEKKCGSHATVIPYYLPCYRESVSCGKKCGKLMSCCGKPCGKICHTGKCEHKCQTPFPALE